MVRDSADRWTLPELGDCPAAVVWSEALRLELSGNRPVIGTVPPTRAVRSRLVSSNSMSFE